MIFIWMSISPPHAFLSFHAERKLLEFMRGKIMSLWGPAFTRNKSHAKGIWNLFHTSHKKDSVNLEMRVWYVNLRNELAVF